MQLPIRSSVLLSTLSPLLANALSLDITSSASIRNASRVVAQDMLSYYHGTEPGQSPGIFGKHYYWGEAGAVWGSLIDYWNYTGDAQYVDLVQQALLWQVGPDHDYMTPNQTKSEGNDDQAIWALAAMRAAELQFPSPSTLPSRLDPHNPSINSSWLDIAVNVFNDQAARWDTSRCGGGLRWQIFTFNQGYDYKNSISTGAFFQLAARLARYTGNQTYADWANKSYDWASSAGYISDDYKVFDGASVGGNCTAISHIQWTYVAGTFMYGSAVMANFTNTNTTWKNRTNDFLSAMSVFFTGANSTHDTAAHSGIMTEMACETISTCNTDQYAYKGLTAQWMGEAMQIAPFTVDKISSYLKHSAEGAARQCSGGHNGTACGTQWTKGKYDGKTGLGQELSALNVFLANLALNSSQYAHKGLTAQWMVEAMQVAPFTVDKISSYLQSSAEGAARQCSGGHNGTACGTQWTKSKYDGKTGLGQELSASNVFLANLALNSSTPTTANTTVATQANSTTAPPSTTGTSATRTAATTSPSPFSGSQRVVLASWTLSLVILTALLSMSPF